MSKAKCICTLGQSLTGDGCRYCQPQEYIDRLEEWLEEERQDQEKLENERDQWRNQVGKICATLPVSKIADATMTIGNLVEYFERLHKENERLIQQAYESRR